MKKVLEFLYLILILFVSISCGEHQPFSTHVHKHTWVDHSNPDTLKCTSGVRSILQDSKGRYWFGSHSEGVCMFDRGVFKYFTTEEGLPNNQVRSIQEDESGQVWFGTAYGVCTYEGDKLVERTSESYVPNLGLKNLDGSLWFNAGHNSGIYQFDGKGLKYLALPIPKDTGTNNSYAVTDVSQGKDDRVWIATYGALFSYDGKVINVFGKEQLNVSDDDYIHMRSVLADSKGQVWMGNNGIGVLLYDGISAINFSEKQGLIHPFSKRNGNHSSSGTLEHVFVIQEDSQGNIWFGGRYGILWRFDGSELKDFTQLKRIQ